MVTFSNMTLALLLKEWPKKLGNVSSAIFLKSSIILNKLLKTAESVATQSALVQQHLQGGTNQLHSYTSHSNAVRNASVIHKLIAADILWQSPHFIHKRAYTFFPVLSPQDFWGPQSFTAFLDFLSRAALLQARAPTPQAVPTLYLARKASRTEPAAPLPRSGTRGAPGLRDAMPSLGRCSAEDSLGSRSRRGRPRRSLPSPQRSAQTPHTHTNSSRPGSRTTAPLLEAGGGAARRPRPLFPGEQGAGRARPFRELPRPRPRVPATPPPPPLLA